MTNHSKESDSGISRFDATGKLHESSEADSSMNDSDAETVQDSWNPGVTPKPEIPDHEMIRIIGRGSYGEVWLARNVVGCYRAVKVVYRSVFESDRPFNREFNGIQNYEPISRQHPSQVDILHVGQRDDMGYFFYVMELADPEESTEDARTLSTLDPETYQPKNLQGVLRNEGRLSVEECIEIGIALTTALTHLHNNGLVHRDIKPANIIFIEGKPKLADIGLVAELEGTMTYVGTEGFLPPEGPGKPAADIFSLGKVLYEMCMGKDRLSFPSLPDDIDQLPERKSLFEFNTILLKACHPSLDQRYQKAEEMELDMECLKSGRSVSGKHRLEHALKTLKKIGTVAALIALVAAGGYSLRKEKTIVRVPKTTDIVIDKDGFWNSWRVPRQFDLDHHGKRLIFINETWNSDTVFLWEQSSGVSRPIPLKNPDGWNLYHPRWSPDGESVLMLGRRHTVAQSGEQQEERFAFIMIHPLTGKVRPIGETLSYSSRPMDFTWRPEGRIITYRSREDALFDLDIDTGESVHWSDFELHGIDSKMSLGDYSPDGKWLLYSAGESGMDNINQRNIWVVPYKGDRANPVVQRTGLNLHPTWAPDGDSIFYSGSDEHGWGGHLFRVQFDSLSGLAHGKPERITHDLSKQYFWPKILKGDTIRLGFAALLRSNRILLSKHGKSSEKEMIAQGNFPKMSSDGSTVYYLGDREEQRGIWAVDVEQRIPQQITEQIPAHQHFSISPDGKFLSYAAYTKDRYAIYRVATDGTSPPVALVNLESTKRNIRTVWSPDSNWIAFADGNTIFAMNETGEEVRSLVQIWQWQGFSLKWSPTGHHLAALGYANPEENESGGISAFLISFPEGRLQRLTPVEEIGYKEGLEWHPSGKKLTYMYYTPGSNGSQIRWANLDGTTEFWFSQKDHWDYFGRWHPDGNQFYFTSFSELPSCRSETHIFDMAKGDINHHVTEEGDLPFFSKDGRVELQTVTENRRQFGIMIGLDE